MGNNNLISVPDMLIANSADIAALQAMQDPIVSIYKMIGPAGAKGIRPQLILNGRKGFAESTKISDILALQDEVVDTKKFKNGGPGTYRFDVTDQASSAHQVWEVRLGGQSEDSQGAPTAVPGGRVPSSTAPAVPAPIADDTVNLGNGLLYNKTFKILTYPDGGAYKWNSTEPLPRDPNAVSVPVTSTPFHLGSLPTFGPNPELDAVKAELARVKEEGKERQRQEELAALRADHQKQIDDTTKRFEALVEKLTARPAEDPIVAELKRKIEDRERQDALRAEINAKMESITTLVREMQTNKGPDPMIGILTQLMQQQSQNAQETLRLVRESANAQLSTSQSSSDRFLEFMQQQTVAAQNSGSSLINEKLVTTLGGVMDIMLKVKAAEAQIGGAGGVNWMEVLEKLTDRAGTAFQSFTQMQARKAAAETAKANAAAIQTRAQVLAEARQARDAEQAKAAASGGEPPTPPAPVTGEAARDALAEKMFPKPAPALAVVSPPAPATPPAEPAAVPPADTVPQKSNRKNDRLAKATLPELRKAFGTKSEEEFFGDFLTPVKTLRDEFEKDPNQYSADDVAQFVLDARGFIAEAAQKGAKLPLVVDMLSYGKFAYLFERMLPDLGEVFWNEAANALIAKIIAEKSAAK
jgi:hypothetical protein